MSTFADKVINQVVFNANHGSGTGFPATLVYTVPAGRRALVYIRTLSLGADGTAQLSVGGATVNGSGGGASNWNYLSGGSAPVLDSAVFGLPLAAGDTIEIVAAVGFEVTVTGIVMEFAQ